jgi:hypothetical protein
MTVGGALVLIAAGAVLRFAISTVYVYGVNLHIVGDILMAVGAVGLLLWMVVWAPWARNRRSSYQANPAAYQQGPQVPYQQSPQGPYQQSPQGPYQQGPAYPERRQVPPTDARTRDLYRADDPYYQDPYRR